MKYLTLEQVLKRLDYYYPSGDGFMARCPVHDDSTPSLKLSKGKDGRLLAKCFAGCKFGQILEALVQKTKKKRQAPSPPLSSESPLSDLGRLDKYEEIAVAVIDLYVKDGSQLVHIENDGFYFYQREGFYKALSHLNIQAAIRCGARLLGERRQELITITESLNKNVRVALQTILKHQFPEIAMNSDRDTLNVKNGLLDLNTMILRPHSEVFFSTVQLEVKYIPDAECPIWLKTLNDIFVKDKLNVRKQKINVLQRFFGLCLTVDTSFQKILIMIGEGANGKSKIIGAVQKILGEENYSSLSMSQLGDKFSLSGLHGKLANFSTELHSNGTVPDEILKKISGEDRIEADRKFKEPLRFRPFSKLVFSMNDMPVITDRTHAFFRRLLVVEFTRIFKEKEQDRLLAQKLATEVNGIFLWMLEGLKELRHRGKFDDGDAMKDAVKRFKRENNNVIGFAEEWCHQVENGECPKDSLYRAYILWCDKNGSKPFTQNRFARVLKFCFSNISEGRTTGGKRIWVGIEFNQQAPKIFRRAIRIKLKIKRRKK